MIFNCQSSFSHPQVNEQANKMWVRQSNRSLQTPTYILNIKLPITMKNRFIHWSIIMKGYCWVMPSSSKSRLIRIYIISLIFSIIWSSWARSDFYSAAPLLLWLLCLFVGWQGRYSITWWGRRLSPPQLCFSRQTRMWEFTTRGTPHTR